MQAIRTLGAVLGLAAGVATTLLAATALACAFAQAANAADRPIRPDRAVYAARKKLCGPFTPCRAYAGLDHVAPRRAVISAMGR